MEEELPEDRHHDDRDDGREEEQDPEQSAALDLLVEQQCDGQGDKDYRCHGTDHVVAGNRQRPNELGIPTKLDVVVDTDEVGRVRYGTRVRQAEPDRVQDRPELECDEQDQDRQDEQEAPEWLGRPEPALERPGQWAPSRPSRSHTRAAALGALRGSSRHGRRPRLSPPTIPATAPDCGRGSTASRRQSGSRAR